ncbi:hypothetical protein SEA_PLATTE_53 [Microbacterium phage Platte]|nr:hypothetical protein SEA_PIONEER3_53 [Microbacterium phage Pioneer3]QZD97646.1 hypothetical protein SEA_PLATTE_53 [Microbacterium phage Platte]
MPTTPGGRFSPGDSDEWDLTTDLAAMQVSNESASANEISAAVSTAIAGIPSPDYRVVATTGARDAIPVANRKKGLLVYTQDTDLLHKWTGGPSGTWQSRPLTAEAWGSVVAAGTGGVTTPVGFSDVVVVNFPAGRFTTPPIVTAQTVGTQGSGSVYVGASVTGVTATSFEVRSIRLGAAPQAGTLIHWHARGV